ncbi:MAG: polyphosphate polymerase domain-containing protein [Oscillospiraceae bacterium]|nr:polyphosphate polymerase domain-containing protein [Oscillospiraceae bacterium]
MGLFQNEFERYEKKYLLDARQAKAVRQALAAQVKEDTYGVYTICSLYYDTVDYRLIRASLERPVFKEKLRVRAYGVPGDGDTVFVELKKKFDGKVFKRRVPMTLQASRDFLRWSVWPEAGSRQVLEEIQQVLRTDELEPKTFLAYDRQAFCGVEDSDLRITLDANIRWRRDRLDLADGDFGEPMLQDGQVLMEVKTDQAVPLWLARCLSRNRIYPASFSKYGTVYKENLIGEKYYV